MKNKTTDKVGKVKILEKVKDKFSKKYILGGGIAGLIAAHYNPDYSIISPNIGGQLKKSKNLLMTFFIHDTLDTRELLDELKIKYTEKKINIYYYYKGKILEKIDEKLKLKFLKSKMCEFDNDADEVVVPDINFSNSNGKNYKNGKNYLDVLDLDINKLVEALEVKEDRIILGKVKLINNNRKFLVFTDENNNLVKLDYEKLISTVPANDFFYMLYNYKSNYTFNYLPSTYVLSSVRPNFMEEDGIYYVYDSNKIYNRVQKFGSGYVYEITGFPDIDEIKKSIGEILEIERRYVGLLFKEEIDDLRNIKFLGRMSQWDYNIHTEEVISKAQQISNMGDIN